MDINFDNDEFQESNVQQQQGFDHPTFSFPNTLPFNARNIVQKLSTAQEKHKKLTKNHLHRLSRTGHNLVEKNNDSGGKITKAFDGTDKNPSNGPSGSGPIDNRPSSPNSPSNKNFTKNKSSTTEENSTIENTQQPLKFPELPSLKSKPPRQENHHDIATAPYPDAFPPIHQPSPFPDPYPVSNNTHLLPGQISAPTPIADLDGDGQLTTNLVGGTDLGVPVKTTDGKTVLCLGYTDQPGHEATNNHIMHHPGLIIDPATGEPLGRIDQLINMKHHAPGTSLYVTGSTTTPDDAYIMVAENKPIGNGQWESTGSSLVKVGDSSGNWQEVPGS